MHPLARRLEAIADRDPQRRLFGASTHRYTLTEPLPEPVLAGFETRHGCVLPEDYRTFLAEVGGGGAGPGYGLIPLGMDDPSGRNRLVPIGRERPPGQPFAHREAVPRPPRTARLLQGTLPLCHRGCGYTDFLVVTGPCAGEVWADHRVDGDGLLPQQGPDGTRLSFLAWWTEWLDGIEQILDRQYRVPARFTSGAQALEALAEVVRHATLPYIEPALADVRRALPREAFHDAAVEMLKGCQIRGAKGVLGPMLAWGTPYAADQRTALALALLCRGLRIEEAATLRSSIHSLDVSFDELRTLGVLPGLRSVRLRDRLGEEISLDALRATPYLEHLAAPDLTALTTTHGIASCAALRSVDLSNAEALRDLRGVEHLTRLEDLSLRNNAALASMTALSSLHSLQRLDLSQVPIRDFAWLRAPELRSLALTDCTEWADATPLARHESLEELVLNGCTAFVDAMPLGGLRSLRHLDLRETSVSSVAPLAACTELESLDLGWCEQVDSLEALTVLPRLRWLGLSGQVVAASDLLAMPALERVDLRNSKVRGMKQLQKHPSLREVLR